MGNTKRHPQAPSVDAIGFELVVIGGASAGKRLLVPASGPRRLFVGSGPDANLRVEDATVSRRHAAVESVRMKLLITDLDSTNGTFVNEVNVGTAYLLGGEVIRLGATSLAATLQVAAPDQEAEISAVTAFGRMKGESARMRVLFAMASRAAATDLSLLIEGETGTGKELLAEGIHEASARADGPFIVIDCASFPTREEDIHAMLFGVPSGPQDASGGGAIEAASGGTLVLDEVGELPLAAQARLLRVTDRRHGLGIVATTSQNLDRLVDDGRFREDLLYRLAGARLEIPPLRHRESDVQVLAQHFWRLQTGGTVIPPALLERLVEQTWPGNVRELETAIARHLALGDLASTANRGAAASGGSRGAVAPVAPPGGPATEALSFKPILDADLAFPEARQRALDIFCAGYVERALAKHGGNVLRAAAGSGIARRYFQTIRHRGRLSR